MKTFYFTATGNSLYVAKKIGGELVSIPQLLKQAKREFTDESIGFVFPCYGFGLPRIVRSFIRDAKFRAEYFFAVMTYGNSAASGLKQIEACGAKAGIAFNYTNEILMVDNFLPLFAMEDQQSKEQSKNIEVNIQQIADDINGRVEKLTRKGLISDVFSQPIHQLAAGILGEAADRLFSVQDTCNRCRVCEKVCPRGNIQVGNKPQFLHKCEVCYACIHHCPQNAIHLKFERSSARFINRNIRLAEIVAANQQK